MNDQNVPAGYIYCRAALQHLQDAEVLINEGDRSGMIDKDLARLTRSAINEALGRLVSMQSKTLSETTKEKEQQ